MFWKCKCDGLKQELSDLRKYIEKIDYRTRFYAPDGDGDYVPVNISDVVTLMTEKLKVKATYHYPSPNRITLEKIK